MKPSLRLTCSTLFLCIFLGLFTEVLLSPFYPQFFRKVFGVEDLSYTGYYIFICRLTVIAISPLWGLLARWIEVKWLLYCGQAGAAIMTALMATANSAEQLTG
jgi:MFS family permease